jgi:hypothetical protein
MSLSTRRARVAALALSLAGGGLLLAASPAQAGVLDTPTTQASVDFGADVTCPATGPGDTSTNNTFAADGASVTTSAASSETRTKTGDPTDVTTMSASVTQKITATQANNALKSVDVQASAQGSLVANNGAAQTCDAGLEATAVNIATFDLPSAKIVTFDLESRSMTAVLAILASNPIDGLSEVAHVESHGVTTQTFYLPAGHWVFEVVSELSMTAPSPTHSTVSSKSGFVNGHMSFDEPGSATTGTTGDGSKYVDLAAGRNCAAGTLTATFKNKAGKGDHRTIKKAIFYVNDVKVASVKKPKKKTSKSFPIASDDEADVLVKLKLAKKGAGSVSVERSYLSCT